MFLRSRNTSHKAAVADVATKLDTAGMATKLDIAELKSELKVDIAELETRLTNRLTYMAGIIIAVLKFLEFLGK